MTVGRTFDLLERYRNNPVKEDALCGKQNCVWIKYSSEDYIDYSYNFSYGLTAKSLRQWVHSPAHAPDSGHRKEMMFLKEEALANLEDITYRQKKMIEERDRRLGELEAIVKRGFVYRSYAYLKKLKGKIGR